MPCVHVCAAIRKNNLSPYAYVSHFYFKIKLYISYPIGTKDQGVISSELEHVKIEPPSERSTQTTLRLIMCFNFLI